MCQDITCLKPPTPADLIHTPSLSVERVRHAASRAHRALLIMPDEPDLNLPVSGRFFSLQLLNPRRDQVWAEASHPLKTLRKKKKERKIDLLLYFCNKAIVWVCEQFENAKNNCCTCWKCWCSLALICMVIMLACRNILSAWLAPIFSILESLPLKGYTAPIHTPAKKRICNDKCLYLWEHYCSRRNKRNRLKLIALSAAYSLHPFFRFSTKFLPILWHT